MQKSICMGVFFTMPQEIRPEFLYILILHLLLTFYREFMYNRVKEKDMTHLRSLKGAVIC